MKRILLCSLLFALFAVMPAYAATLDFEGFGDWVDIGTTYDTLGITFTPNTQKVCAGLSHGDPGNWALEGTNGPDFLCFNGGNPGYTMELNFTSSPSFVSLDVSRSGGSSAGDTFTINAYNGIVLLDTQTVILGPINTWTTVTINATGINRITWDGAGVGFHPYGIDNLIFPQAQAVPGVGNSYVFPPFPLICGVPGASSLCEVVTNPD